MFAPFLTLANLALTGLLNCLIFFLPPVKLEEPLYTIMLNPEEIVYLCEALERGMERMDCEVTIWIFESKEEAEMQVILNECGYGLVSDLQFGGAAWARVEQ